MVGEKETAGLCLKTKINTRTKELSAFVDHTGPNSYKPNLCQPNVIK